VSYIEQFEQELIAKLNGNEPKYVSKKHDLVNQKAELKGKLEALEHKRQNRFEPAIRFISEAKRATILLSTGKPEEKRDFLRKIGSNFQVAEKSLAVEFKNPWNLLAEFNSDLTTSNARQRENPSKDLWRREGDSNPTVLPVNKGKSDGDSRIDSRNPITSCPDLAQIVMAWAKLPAPLKAAILAIVNSAEGQP
jgi:hypothetical protein